VSAKLIGNTDWGRVCGRAGAPSLKKSDGWRHCTRHRRCLGHYGRAVDAEKSAPPDIEVEMNPELGAQASRSEWRKQFNTPGGTEKNRRSRWFARRPKYETLQIEWRGSGDRSPTNTMDTPNFLDSSLAFALPASARPVSAARHRKTLYCLVSNDGTIGNLMTTALRRNSMRFFAGLAGYAL